MLTRPPKLRLALLVPFVALVMTLVIAVLAPAAPAQTPAQSVDDADLLTPTSVGPAIVGATVEELTELLGPDYDIGDEVRITVDFNGHVVSRDGQVQFRAVKASAPDERLTLFIVSGENFRTAEGVGPGTTIADGEDAYGEATLSWNPDQEGREFVMFENQPEGRLQFRTPGIAGTNVGIYGDDEFETNDYEDDAMIAAVWISCVPDQDCPSLDGGDDADAGTDDDADAGADDATDDATDSDDDDDADAGSDDSDDDADADAGGDDSDDDGAGGAAGQDNDADGVDELPQTGATEVVLVAVSAVLVLIGGAMATINRRFLAPSWLS